MTECTEWDRRPGSCGTLFETIQVCTDCGVWDAPSYPISPSASISMTDPAVTHECGRPSATPGGWDVIGDGPGGCSDGQVVFEWTGVLPTSTYGIYLDGSLAGMEADPALKLEVLVDGTSIDSRAPYVSWSSRTPVNAWNLQTDCGTATIRVRYVSSYPYVQTPTISSVNVNPWASAH
jgi:hypothetical protein